MCTISLSLAKPGEAMPGPYSSLMVLRSPACVPERSRLGGPGEKTDNADTALIRLFYFKQRRRHVPRRGACRDCYRRRVVRRVHAGIATIQGDEHRQGAC